MLKTFHKFPLFLILAVTVCSGLAGISGAQSFPEYNRLTVNDYAGLLPDAEEEILANRLDKLRSDTGVEMTVLTLASQSPYAPDLTLEQFATALFNAWGVGNASRNDGVLVLILRDDRAMRIELGAGYARAWDKAAQKAVDEHFLPAFAAENYASGILTGSASVIDTIITPSLEGADPPKDIHVFWFMMPFLFIFGLIAGRQKIADGLARFRTCPQCGKKGLRQSRTVTHSATTSLSGSGIMRTWCTLCDYATESNYMIPRRTNSSSSGFGGGSSGGGGASGRW